MKYLSLSMAVALLTAFTSPAQAAVIGITAVTWDVAVSSPIVEDASLTSVTAGTTYTILTGATSAAGVTSATLGTPYYSASGTDPVTGVAAIVDGSGLRATSGTNGVGNGADVFFGQNVDGLNLFLIDFGGQDNITIHPLDSGGSLIGDFALATTSGGDTDFSPPSISMIGAATVTSGLRGIVFNTSDFTGTGTLTGVEGIRLLGAGLDLNAVGIAAVIPEPSSLALLLVGTCGMVLRRWKS